MSTSVTRVVHRFLRQPNINSSVTNRIGNRYDPFVNTLTHLKDPENNRELYLIGTTNSSTTLAYRTKKLIEQVRPTTLYVQTSNVWWDIARNVQVPDQQTFREVSKGFPDEAFVHTNNLRGILWRVRYNLWRYKMRAFCNFPQDFTPFTPGLQTKLALEQAEKVNAHINFGGVQFDPITQQALRTQSRMYAHSTLFRGARILFKPQNAWANQYSDFMNILHTRGGEAFAESMDRSRANFMVGLLSKFAPDQKKILVDNRDQLIFRELYDRSKGEKIVAVVNQWHMQGVETHWRRATNTQQKVQIESPVADMDIDGYQETHVINAYLRDLTSKRTRSEPASDRDYLTNYHKENYEYERTRHTHHRSAEDVPEPGQQNVKPHH